MPRSQVPQPSGRFNQCAVLCMSLAGRKSPRELGGHRATSPVSTELCSSQDIVDVFLIADHIRYIYRIFMGADGNHSLHKKSKRDDKSDYSLSAGHAFFADCAKMASFAKKTSTDRTVVCILRCVLSCAVTPSYSLCSRYQVRTCSGFKVTRSQRAGKFRNMDISGVVAVSCLRHGCFFPRSVVDLVGNEQCVLCNVASDCELPCLTIGQIPPGRPRDLWSHRMRTRTD